MTEIDAEIIKSTQKSLGEYFKKPPLTEKLLSRPPFRFLHDIVTSVISTTGFMKGLFTEQELNSENVKEKAAKINFLKKLIGIVSLVLNSPIKVNPASIVAGKEAENTNFLLQSLAKALSKKVDNNTYVTRTLSGEADKLMNSKVSNTSEIKSTEKQRSEVEKTKHSGRSSNKNTDTLSNEVVQNDLSKTNEIKKMKENTSEEKLKEKHSIEKSKEKHNDEKFKDKPAEEKSIKKLKKERTEKDVVLDKETKEQDRSIKSKSEKRISEASNNGEFSQNPLSSGALDNKSESPHMFENDADSSKRLTRPSSAKGTRHRHENDPSILRDDKESEKKKSIVRPPSARPAPPKVRKSSEVGLDDSINNQTKVSGLIIDVDRDSDDGDYVVEEYVGGGEIDVKFSHTNVDSSVNEGEHGSLVQSIIQSKKEFINNEKVDVVHHSDIQRKRERLSTEKEIEKIRQNLQALTKSINPLGKLIDFIQEDLDTMQKESEKWRSENDELQKALQSEQNVTNKILKPIKEKLDEQNKIKVDQEEAIAKFKANIEKYSSKIETILLSSCSIRA